MKFYFDGMDEKYCEELTASIKENSNVYVVGWRPDSNMWPYDFFTEKKCNISLIEIFEDNAKQFPSKEYDTNVICDSVENFSSYVSKQGKKKNVLYWADGPEHLEMENSKKLLEEAKKYFYLIIIQTPDGVYEQGEMYGNIHESHLSHWYDSDYEELGFKFEKVNPSNPAIIGFHLS